MNIKICDISGLCVMIDTYRCMAGVGRLVLGLGGVRCSR